MRVVTPFIAAWGGRGVLVYFERRGREGGKERGKEMEMG